MDVKVPLSSGVFTTDVAPLPSAPPPSYEDACGTASNIYPAVPLLHQGTPLMSENQIQSSPATNSVPGNPPYPVQQVQITPAAIAVTAGARHIPVGRQPLKTTCPGCHKSISTKLRITNRHSPTFWCILLCLTCICIPCSCCPYFCQNGPLKVEHFCPRCNAFLGAYVNHS